MRKLLHVVVLLVVGVSTEGGLLLAADAQLPELAGPLLAAVQQAEGVPGGFGIADNDHRAPYHLDSWIGLAMLFSALGIAVALNHPSGAMRRVGYFSCALVLLGIGSGLLLMRFHGVFANFEEVALPPDAVKPFLLTFQAILAFVGGLYMLWLTATTNSEPDKTFTNANDEARYGLYSRYLHWVTAFVFLLLIPMGVLMSALPHDIVLLQYVFVIHKALGFTLLILVFIRLIWNRKSPRPSLSRSLKPWESKMAHGVHIALYVILFTFPISGYMMSTGVGKWSHFFFVDIPLLFEPSMGIARPFGLLHKILLPYLFYLIIFAHIVGALKHHYIDADVESVRRMVS
jgi:cytochrome b561